MKRHQRVRLALAAAGLLLAGNALADGFYFGLSGGVSMPGLPSKSEFDATLTGGSFTSSLDDTAEAWGAQIGYRWGSYVAAEIGYVDFGRAEYLTDFTGTTQRYSVRYLSTGPTVAVLGMLPLGERFDFHARAGILFADTRVRDRIEAGFRNVLVHGYDDVDLGVVKDVLAHHLNDLSAFVVAVRERLALGPGAV